MGSFSKAYGIDVTVHVSDDGCGNPCHPGHACSVCEPYWQSLQETGQFTARVPMTFAGSDPIHKTNLGARKLDFAHGSRRKDGKGSL